MPGYVTVQIIGDIKGVQAMLSHLETKLLSPAVGAWLTAEVQPYLQERLKQRFDAEGDDVVGKWVPLTAATEAIRTSQGFPAAHPINDRTGELRNYLLNTPGAVNMSPAGATLTMPGTPASGELADKLKTAQSGRDNPLTVPRPVLGMNEADLAAVLTMMATEIQRQ